VTAITVALALVALTTAVLWMIEPRLDKQHLIFIYFVPTALIAIRYGSTSAMCVTIASSFTAAYFLYPPHFSFLVASPLDLLELALFSLLALLASQVVSGFASDSDVAKRRQRAASRLRGTWLATAALFGRARSK
jgi:K+-sensing histidine kinase KdpD